jgi:glycosyltransferase involved in cell wall biosynthesis
LELKTLKIKNNISVSIITPYYFGSAVILRALGSIIGQLEKDFYVQIIVVFDSPSDIELNTVARLIKERVSGSAISLELIYNKNNLGAVASRHIALEYADGDYVIFLDQDDELAQGRLGSLRCYAGDVLLYQAVKVDEYGVTRESHSRYGSRLLSLKWQALSQILIVRRQPARFGAVTMKRFVARENLARTGGGGEEWEFFSNMVARRLKFDFTPAIGLIRHQHGANTSQINRAERLLEWRHRISRKSGIGRILKIILLILLSRR